jgi:hypothetical protein
MVTTDDLRIVEGGTDYVIGHRSGETKRGGGWFDGESTGLLPDLTDAATVGCLLALVREAWVDLHMVAHCDDRYGKTVWWLSRWGDLPRSCECSTEAAALVASLEAAP